jgi:hypothetical protein
MNSNYEPGGRLIIHCFVTVLTSAEGFDFVSRPLNAMVVCVSLQLKSRNGCLLVPAEGLLGAMRLAPLGSP